MRYFTVIAGLSLIASVVCSCTARPIKSGTLGPQYKVTAPAVPESTVSADDQGFSVESIRALNEQAGRPTFGIIGGLYQLPTTGSASQVSLSEGQFLGGGYLSLSVSGRSARPISLTPMDVADSFAMQSVLNSFLDAGVKIVEISLADASRVANAEASDGNSRLLSFSRTLPSGADYLISMQRGNAEGVGEVWAGRVVSTKTGLLLAFDSVPAFGSYTVQPLLKKLVGSALRRLAAQSRG